MLNKEIEKQVRKNRKVALNQLRRIVASIIEKHCSSEEAIEFVAFLVQELMRSFPELEELMGGVDYAV
jgi:hypothetical protein